MPAQPLDPASTVHEQGLRLLAVINEIIVSEATELGLLQAIAQPLQAFSSADHVGVVRIHEITGETFFIAEHPPTPMIGTQLPNDETSLTAILRRTRSELAIDDVATSPLITNDLRVMLLGVGAKSMLLLPLVDAQRALFGSIGFDFGAPHALPDATRRHYLRVAVMQIAVAATRLRLQVQSQRQAEQLQKINAYARRIAPDMELTQALKVVLESAQTLEPFDYIALYLKRANEAHLRLSALWRGGTATILSEGLPMTDSGYTPYHQAFMDAAPTLIRDLAADSMWSYPQAIGIRTLAAYPLIMQAEPFGVLELGSAQPYAYSQATLDIFQQFANETALLISGVLATLQARSRLSVKVQASELTSTLQQQTEMSTMIQTTLKTLASAFSASRARIRLGTPPESKG
ncbi:MAG: GAF domain-containing protein [Anaerolineae bacterium]